MALMITDECTNCGACEAACPNTAVYEGGREWTWAGGTKLTGPIEYADGSVVGAEMPNAPLSEEYYYIVSEKCNECVGFHEEPQCAAVCPMDCCVPDPDYRETEERLLDKARWLYQSPDPFTAYAAARKPESGSNPGPCGCSGKAQE